MFFVLQHCLLRSQSEQSTSLTRKREQRGRTDSERDGTRNTHKKCRAAAEWQRSTAVLRQSDWRIMKKEQSPRRKDGGDACTESRWYMESTGVSNRIVRRPRAFPPRRKTEGGSRTYHASTLLALLLPQPPGSFLLLLLASLLLPSTAAVLTAASRPSGSGTGASNGMPALLGSPCRGSAVAGEGRSVRLAFRRQRMMCGMLPPSCPPRLAWFLCSCTNITWPRQQNKPCPAPWHATTHRSKEHSISPAKKSPRGPRSRTGPPAAPVHRPRRSTRTGRG